MTTASIEQPKQMVITLDGSAAVKDIKTALKLIRGIASVSVPRASKSGKNIIESALSKQIAKARADYKKGETVHFENLHEIDAYFDNL